MLTFVGSLSAVVVISQPPLAIHAGPTALVTLAVSITDHHAYFACSAIGRSLPPWVSSSLL